MERLRLLWSGKLVGAVVGIGAIIVGAVAIIAGFFL